MNKPLFSFFLLAILFLQSNLAQEKNKFEESSLLIEQKEEFKKHQILTDRFHLEFGLYIPTKQLKVGANGSLPNLEIDFGDTFDFNDSELTFFGHMEWYFAKKWKISVENFNIQNAKKIELEEDINWEDIVFKKGTSARGGFSINLYRVYVGRVISEGLKHQLGIGLGVHALNTSAFIEGEIAIDDFEYEFQRRSVNGIIPLPNIGFWYFYAPNNKWAFIARLDWFSITIDEYSGSLSDIAPGIKYQIFKHFGIGIDYRYFFVNAKVNKSEWDGRLNLGFNGPVITLHTNF